jgi:hypothetical protein
MHQFQDLLADVRDDGQYHSIRELIQPNEETVQEVADVLIQGKDFIADAQDFVHIFTKYKDEFGHFWATQTDLMTAFENYKNELGGYWEDAAEFAQDFLKHRDSMGDYWAKPSETIKNQIGDCITGDTPVWIRVRGEISLVEIRELLPKGDFGVFGGIDIFTPSGFVPLNSITRKGIRPTYRILSTSAVGITPEHKIIVNQNLHGNDRYQSVKEVNFNQIIRLYPELPIKLCCNYETAWAYGLFFSDGSAGLGARGKGGFWRIVNANRDYLKRAAIALAKIFPEFYFSIDSFDSYKKFFLTNLGPRQHKLYCLNAHLFYNHVNGLKDDLIKRFRADFYNGLGIKKVPSFILTGDTEVSAGFWDGVWAGDGQKDGNRITCKNKIGTLGLSMVLRKIGKVAYVTPDHEASRILGHNQIEEGKNWRIDGGDQEVFDVSTASGEFVAGDLAIKNCDCFSILLCSILRNFIDANSVFCAIGFLNPAKKDSGHMWVVTIDKTGKQRIVESTASSKQPITGVYEVEALFNDQFAFASPKGVKDFDLITVPMDSNLGK